jgi:hypothetical protein
VRLCCQVGKSLVSFIMSLDAMDIWIVSISDVICLELYN